MITNNPKINLIDEQKDNVKNKTCRYKNCAKRTEYNPYTNMTTLYCEDHKENININFDHTNIENHPIQNVFEEEITYSYVNYYCVFLECSSRAFFSYCGDKTPLYCSKHSEKYHVNMFLNEKKSEDSSKRKCKLQNCIKNAKFGDKVTKTPIYCYAHKNADHIAVKPKKCSFENCQKIPSYGNSSDDVSLFCYAHKNPEHKDVIHKSIKPSLYNRNNCRKISFTEGFTGENNVNCTHHKDINHVRVVTKMCIFPECKQRSYFGDPNERNPLYCNLHRFYNHVKS